MSEQSKLNKTLENHVKEIYLWEHNRKDNINDSLTLPVGLTIALCSVVAFYLQNIPGINFSLWHIIFYISVFCLLFSIIKVISLLFKTLHGHKYQYIATTQEVLDYKNELDKKHIKAGTSSLEDLTDRDLREYLFSEYCRCADINAKNNDNKIKFLQDAKKYLLYATIALLISAIPFYIIKSSVKNEISSTTNVSEEEVITMPEENPKPTGNADPKPSTEPKPPPPRIIEEGADVPEKK